MTTGSDAAPLRQEQPNPSGKPSQATNSGNVSGTSGKGSRSSASPPISPPNSSSSSANSSRRDSLAVVPLAIRAGSLDHSWLLAAGVLKRYFLERIKGFEGHSIPERVVQSHFNDAFEDTRKWIAVLPSQRVFEDGGVEEGKRVDDLISGDADIPNRRRQAGWVDDAADGGRAKRARR